jgi:hypothetical protein
MSSGSSTGTGRDAERDAYLREALRHAPDAGAAAPAALSDAILRQARIATGSLATPAQTSGDTPPQHARTQANAKHRAPASPSLWSLLLRPPVAAGFASLMVATLVGVMWWDRPIADPLTEARAPVAATPAPRAQAPAQPAPREPGAADTLVAAAPQGAANARRTMKSSDASPIPAPGQSTNDAAVAAKKSARPEPKPTPGKSRTPVPAPEAAPAFRDETAVGATLAKSAAPAVAASPMSERRREGESAAEMARPDARTRVAEAGVPNVDVPGPAPAQEPAAAAQAAARPFAQAKGSAGASADRGDSVAGKLADSPRLASELAPSRAASPNPVSRLRAAVSAEPGAWTWQRGNGAEQPMNDAAQAWLGRLDDATRSRWQTAPAAAASPVASAGASDGRPLRLLRNGRLHTTVHVDAAAVRVEAAGDAALGAAGGAADAARAPLPAATAAALKAALEQAAP